MNTSMLSGNWTEIKGKIKTQWAKFNDNDIDELKGNLNQLAGKIEKIYGYGKEQAEKEFNEFKKTLISSVNHAATAVLEKTDAFIAAGTEVKEDVSAAVTSINKDKTNH